MWSIYSVSSGDSGLRCAHIILHFICTQHSKTGVKNCTKPVRKLGVKKVLVPEINCRDQSKPDSKPYMFGPNAETIMPTVAARQERGYTWGGRELMFQTLGTSRLLCREALVGSQSPVRFNFCIFLRRDFSAAEWKNIFPSKPSTILMFLVAYMKTIWKIKGL